MRVIATDADQENTLHSQIYYSIVESSNTAGMFIINSKTGEVMVRQNTLDREVRHFTDLKFIIFIGKVFNLKCPTNVSDVEKTCTFGQSSY